MNKEDKKKETVFFFLDDKYINTNDRKVFCYGGYFIDAIDMEELNKTLAMIKINLGLEEWMPVKWNFSGELKKFYKQNWQINDFEERWREIKNKSKEIRKNLLKEINGIKILFSAFAASKKETSTIREFMIKNLFQRVGLNLNASCLNILICDYEYEKSEARKILEKTYFDAYYKAPTYFSGPLKKRGAFQSLCYSSTYLNQFLQLSDIIVGCLGELINNWLKKEEPQDFVKEIFQILRDKFVKNQFTGEIFRYGIIVKPENFNDFLHEKELI